jgi:7-cyano-7-deazaguanine synthase in queuosine biosynthesis
MIDMIINSWNVKVHPLIIKRGARAEKLEEEAFDYFIDYYKAKYPENIGNAEKLDVEIPPKKWKEYFPKELALSVGHPMRNATMQNLAINYAVAVGEREKKYIRTILVGSVADDGKIPESGMLSLRAQTLSACINTGDWKWQITSPFIDYFLNDNLVFKKDLISYAMAKGIPLERTRSCFESSKEACGVCFACKKRLEAFTEAGISDPIPYKINLDSTNHDAKQETTQKSTEVDYGK